MGGIEDDNQNNFQLYKFVRALNSAGEKFCFKQSTNFSNNWTSIRDYFEKPIGPNR